MQYCYKSFTLFILLTTTILLDGKGLLATDYIQESGDILQIALPCTAIAMTIYYKDGTGALQFIESFGLTVGVTYFLKYSINEERPNGGNYSFPSGHTSASFAAAEFILERYGWKYGVPAFVVASYVGYTRIESHQHHMHDVVAGAAIGILSSYIFTKPFKGWQIRVEGDTKSIGMQFSRSF